MPDISNMEKEDEFSMTLKQISEPYTITKKEMQTILEDIKSNSQEMDSTKLYNTVLSLYGCFSKLEGNYGNIINNIDSIFKTFFEIDKKLEEKENELAKRYGLEKEPRNIEKEQREVIDKLKQISEPYEIISKKISESINNTLLKSGSNKDKIQENILEFEDYFPKLDEEYSSMIKGFESFFKDFFEDDEQKDAANKEKHKPYLGSGDGEESLGCVITEGVADTFNSLKDLFGEDLWIDADSFLNEKTAIYHDVRALHFFGFIDKKTEKGQEYYKINPPT